MPAYFIVDNEVTIRQGSRSTESRCRAPSRNTAASSSCEAARCRRWRVTGSPSASSDRVPEHRASSALVRLRGIPCAEGAAVAHGEGQRSPGRGSVGHERPHLELGRQGRRRAGSEEQPRNAKKRLLGSSPGSHDDVVQRSSYSSWRRHQTPASLRPLGARSSHWYMPQRPSTRIEADRSSNGRSFRDARDAARSGRFGARVRRRRSVLLWRRQEREGEDRPAGPDEAPHRASGSESRVDSTRK